MKKLGKKIYLTYEEQGDIYWILSREQHNYIVRGLFKRAKDIQHILDKLYI